MDATPIGRRLVTAVVPRYFANINQLSHALGVSYSTVHAWQREENPTTPGLDMVEAVGRLVGMDWISLLGGAASPKIDRLEDLPGWKAAVAEARARWPTRATTAGYAAAGAPGRRAPQRAPRRLRGGRSRRGRRALLPPDGRRRLEIASRYSANA